MSRQDQAKCPDCKQLVSERDGAGTWRKEVECECGAHLTHVVPVIAPPMGGPAYWGWKTGAGLYSWEVE